MEQEMKTKRLFWVVNKIQDRRRKNDRIIQALAGALANGHLWCKPHHVKFIAQLDDFNPLTDDNKDDVLDMVSMAVTAQNPYLMEDESVIEVEMRRIYDEEDEITDIEWRGAP
jgi:hypothetical protein